MLPASTIIYAKRDMRKENEVLGAFKILANISMNENTILINNVYLKEGNTKYVEICNCKIVVAIFKLHLLIYTFKKLVLSYFSLIFFAVSFI